MWRLQSGVRWPLYKHVPQSDTASVRVGRTVTLAGVLVNVFLIFFKFMAGVVGRSQALIADAVHSISDLMTDAVVLVGLRLGRKAPDQDHPFGHGRLETLSSAVVGLALVGVAVYIGVDAGRNIYNHTEYHPTWLALIAAVVSIVLKEILYQYTVHVGRRLKSLVIMANAWHHRSDALSSIAVLLGVAGARINPQWHILDAYAALLVSFFIVKVGFNILLGAARELADTAPAPEVLEDVKRCIQRVTGVLALHDLKVRTSRGLYQMEVHIVVDGGLTVSEGHRIAKQVESQLKVDLPDLTQVIIHVDPYQAGRTTISPRK